MRGIARCALMLACLTAVAVHAQPGPRPPCPGSDDGTDHTRAPYGALNGQPRVATWRDLELRPRAACPGPAAARFELAIALAGRFEHAGSMEEMAARIGAVSALRDLRYWSVTDGRWRPLLAESFALEDASEPRRRRPDFGAAEVLSGETLFFAQDDTRTTGLNVFALRVLHASPDALVFETRNVTALRLLILTVFPADSVLAYHYLQRDPAGTWRYYGLTLVRAGGTPERERSLVNRAAAYYRFLAGQPSAGAPPLAP